MRKIALKTWQENGNDTTIINVFKTLILTQDPRTAPKGIDQFLTFKRIGEAFEKGEKSNVLELVEGDFLLLKSMIEKDVPRTWGMVSGLSDAVVEFLEAKKVGKT